MVNLANLARAHLDHNPVRDLQELGRLLCNTPMFALSTTWPSQEAALLLNAEAAPRA